MNILKPFIGVTAIALLGAFAAAQAAPMVANALTVRGTLVNQANGITLVPSGPLNLSRASLVDACDPDDRISTLPNINSSGVVAFKQLDKQQVGADITFSYTYVDANNSNNTCAIYGVVNSDGSIASINASGSGDIYCSVTDTSTVTNYRTFYTVVIGS